MRGSDDAEEELEADELEEADATVSVPVDEALAVALGADEAEEDAQPTAHEAGAPAGALPPTKLTEGQPVSFLEPTFINDVQRSAEIAAAAESFAAESSGAGSPGAESSGAGSPGAESSGAGSPGAGSPGAASSGAGSPGAGSPAAMSTEARAASAPAPVDASPASRPRPTFGGWVARGVIAAAMALGVGVIVHHLATAGAQPTVGPLRLVAGTEAHVASRPAPTIDIHPEDASRPIPELARAAADALGAGRLEEAARRYAALARRAPHQPAYVAAARVLAAQVRR